MENTVVTKRDAIAEMPKFTQVAAYARVSSGKDEMLHSLAAQVSYFSNYIRRHPGWTFAGIYVDEAVTGTKNSRPKFMRMIGDCRLGRIDMVLTKSISRFARNTVDLLETVRELKALEVDVYFEEQNIHTLSEEGELMLSLLASFAQAESLSASDNSKWRIMRNFQNGMPQSVSMMGYRITQGDFEIIPEEAAVVWMVFKDYLGGMGRNAIQRKLTNLGIKSKEGKSWHNSIIASMLSNEKYVGDLLMQKYFRPDHLTKVDRINKGEAAQYFIQDHHVGIVDRETFDAVQSLMISRREKNRTAGKRADHPFCGKVICGNCGKNYRRKTAHGKISWQCSTFLELGKDHCHAKQIPEDVLIDACRDALGLRQYDALVFDKRIREIRIPQPNQLRIIFQDGNEMTRIWQDRSRKDSWTDEMRQAAKELMNRRWHSETER